MFVFGEEEIGRLFPFGSLRLLFPGRGGSHKHHCRRLMTPEGRDAHNSASPVFDYGGGGSRSSASPALEDMVGERRSLQFDGVANGG